jgi:alkanesulfonate monooxygenase SsuD/methylene tetrahydromethanopterin reductase-like flavin-dependent oxidoreductase (luciferase family)
MLGIGAGYQPYEFERFGVDIVQNLEMTDEFCDILDLAFSGDFFSYNGKHYQMPENSYPGPPGCNNRCRSTSPAIPRRCSALPRGTAIGC